jgi:hypothetical protein
MTTGLPTSAQMKSAFGGKGVVSQTTTVFKQLRDEEQRGRGMRDAQVQDNCSFQWSQLAVFSEEALASGQMVTDWIEFGTLRFTAKPVFLTGSEWVPQEGEPSVNAERSDLDPLEHLIVPGGAEVVGWKTDERGYYKAAKLVLFAYGSVPSDYRVTINGLWVGPAIRKA